MEQKKRRMEAKAKKQATEKRLMEQKKRRQEAKAKKEPKKVKIVRKPKAEPKKVKIVRKPKAEPKKVKIVKKPKDKETEGEKSVISGLPFETIANMKDHLRIFADLTFGRIEKAMVDEIKRRGSKVNAKVQKAYNDYVSKN